MKDALKDLNAFIYVYSVSKYISSMSIVSLSKIENDSLAFNSRFISNIQCSFITIYCRN